MRQRIVIDVRGAHPVVIVDGMRTYNFGLDEDVQAFKQIELPHHELDDTEFWQLQWYLIGPDEEEDAEDDETPFER